MRGNVLDDACVTVNSEPPAKAFVYHYSGDVKASGNAVVRDRHDFKFSWNEYLFQKYVNLYIFIA